MNLAVGLLRLQAGVTLFAAIALGITSIPIGLSAAAGGLICMAGTAWQARTLFGTKRVSSAEDEGGSNAAVIAGLAGAHMVRSEIGKWLLIASLFVLAFGVSQSVLGVSYPLPLLGTFAVAQCCYIAAPLFRRNRRR